jgi:hypothetical protein
MNSNNITNIGDLVDTTGNNKIDMNDPALLNGMNIQSNVGINLQESTTTNRIGINNGGLASQVVNGGTTISNIDAGNDLTIDKQNGGDIVLNNSGPGLVLINNSKLDMNNNGLINCNDINGLTAVGGLSSGTSNSATLSGSTAEQSILATTFVGSRQAPANTFKQGDAYVATLAGNFSSDGADTLTLRLKGGATGTTTLSTLVVPLNNSSGVYYELEINFVVRQIGAAGVADLAINYDFTYNQTAMGGSFSGERLCESNTTTFDTTILNQLDITAQFSSTSGSNSIETILSTLGKTY